MWKTLPLLALVSVFVLNGWNDSQPSADAQLNAPQDRPVLWSEIGGPVKIMGRLGIPLEEMMSVQGVWNRPPDTKTAEIPLPANSVSR